METKRICVKVGNLKKVYNTPDINLEKWLKDPDNIYCGRPGRIFITHLNDNAVNAFCAFTSNFPKGNDNAVNARSAFTKYFAYEGSKWANPFTLKKHDIDESLKLYKEYITNKISENPEKYNLDELRNKNLGCWCNPENKCHVDILYKLATGQFTI